MSTPIGSSQWMYATGAEVTQQSLKFNDDESQYLSWTPAAAGNRKTWTFSAWVKRATFASVGGTDTFFSAGPTTPSSGNPITVLQFSGDQLQIDWYDGSGDYYTRSSAVYRDPSAWYHIVFTIDTTLSTAADRAKLYVNGEQVTSFNAQVTIPQNTDYPVNNTVAHYIGKSHDASQHFDGYLSDVYFIDGQALDPTSFGQSTNGYWKKIDYAGTYGTNGFHLTFQDDVVSEGFNVATYRGDGNNTASISGLGFSPDLLWIKNRTDSSNQNLMDSVRGASVRLLPSSTLAEVSSFLGSFDGDGFTFSGGNDNDVNQAGDSYVAWAWDAGSGSPVSNTDGSITSTVKANPSYGFSIVTWTATTGTVGHGLGTAPELIIEKRRSSTSDWIVGTTAIDGSNDYLRLNTTVGKAGSVSASPTATVFTPNTGSGDVVAYCFADVEGFSKVGSYTGNGSADGPFVYTGFRPAWVMVKRTDAANNWIINDNKRGTYNVEEDWLYANLSNAETQAIFADFTSNGFKLRNNASAVNASGGTYIYLSFAENPFKYANAR